MTPVSKYIPWITAAVLLIFLAFIWQDSRNQIEQKNLEIANLRTQLEKIVAESNSKITEANSKYKQLIEEANQKIQLANQREVQVSVVFRKAYLSSGHVAGIVNISGKTIAITADINRPSSGQQQSFRLTIDRGQTKEIGEREGWAFIPGDVITISQPDYKPLAFTAP